MRAISGGHGKGPRGQLSVLPGGSLPCPVPGCSRQISKARLMCRRHWNLVPKELRDRVWATWQSGHGALSPEHRHAVGAAITVAARPPAIVRTNAI